MIAGKYDLIKILTQFKVKGPLISCEPYGEGHNLDRARTQIKLVSDMEKQFDKMDGLVKEF